MEVVHAPGVINVLSLSQGTCKFAGMCVRTHPAKFIPCNLQRLLALNRQIGESSLPALQLYLLAGGAGLSNLGDRSQSFK